MHHVSIFHPRCTFSALFLFEFKNEMDAIQQSKRRRMIIVGEDEGDESQEILQEDARERDLESVDSNPDDLNEFVNEEDLRDEEDGEDLADNWLR